MGESMEENDAISFSEKFDISFPNEAFYIPDVQIDPDSMEPFFKMWFKFIEEELKNTGEDKQFIPYLKRLKRKGHDDYYSERIFIEKVSDHVGYGVFAKVNIPKNSVIGQYAGILRYLDDEDELLEDVNGYLFSFPDEAILENWVIDARIYGSFARFINHASKQANLKPIEFLSYQGPMVMFVSRRKILAGEQLLYNYGDTYWEDLGYDPDLF